MTVCFNSTDCENSCYDYDFKVHPHFNKLLSLAFVSIRINRLI